MPFTHRLGLRYAKLDARRRWLLVAAWYGVIFTLSQSPGTDVDSTAAALALFSLVGLNSAARLAAHLGLFGGLALLVLGALSTAAVGLGAGTSPAVSNRAGRVLAALTFTVCLGVLDEWHQGHVPRRHFRIQDIATDAIGAALALSVPVIGPRLKRPAESGTAGWMA